MAATYTRMIKLPDGYVAKVDTEDYQRVASITWGIANVEGYTYVVHRWKEDGQNRATYLHRVVTEAPRGVMVRFRSSDTLDCRKRNLRLA